MVMYSRDDRHEWRPLDERVLRYDGATDVPPREWDRSEEMRFARDVSRFLRDDIRDVRFGRDSERFGRLVGEGFRAIGYAFADVLHRAVAGYAPRVMDDRWVRGESWRRGLGPKGYVRSDDRIKEDVSDVLTEHSAIDASDVEVDVKGGIVTLTGTMATRQEKRLAEDVIESMLGVKEVNNQLRTKPRMSKH